MSTSYHTPIVTGAAANAAIINDPLGDLDAAILAEKAIEATARAAADNALDDRIDNIVGYAGTSTVEVVDARTAGNVGSAAATLSDRLEWLEGAQNVYAAAFGFDDGATAAANLTALNAATAAAAAFAAPAIVWLPAGKFTCNNATIPAGVVLRGARMPVYDRVADLLIGGTILDNCQISLSDFSGVMDLGIDVTAKNGILDAGNDDCIVLNVCVNGSTATVNHGILTSGNRHVICNYHASNVGHALVFKGQYNMAQTVTAWNCQQSAFIVKSDLGVDCIHNSCVGLISDGTAAGDAGKIHLHAEAGFSVLYNTISDFHVHNANYGVLLQHQISSAALCKYNVISNGIMRDITLSGVLTHEPTTTQGDGCDYNLLSNLIVIDSGAYSFGNNYGGGNNQIVGCMSISPAGGHVTGTFAQYGVNQQSGLIAKMSKSADQTIGTGTGSYVDLTWASYGGPFDVLDPDGDNTAEIGDVPYSNGVYRLMAYVQFDANNTGNRYVAIRRTVNGTDYATVATKIVGGRSGTIAQGVEIEYIATLASAYRFKIGVMQDSGGDLNVDLASYVVLQALK